MSKGKWLRITSVLAVLALLTGSALAGQHVAPATPTVEVTAGSDGNADAYFGLALSAETTVMYGGHIFVDPNNTGVMDVWNVPGTSVTRYGGVTSTDALEANAFFRDSATNDYMYFLFGTRVVADGTHERGFGQAKAISGATQWNWDDRGDDAKVTNFTAATLLDAGDNSGEVAVVGYTNGGTPTGVIDVYMEIIDNATGAIVGTAVQFGTATHTTTPYTVFQRADGTLLIGGSDEVGGQTDFYLTQINQDGTAAAGFSGPTLTRGGDLDVIRKIKETPGGDVVIVGTTGATAKGYVALLSAAGNAYTTKWEYTIDDAATDIYDVNFNADDNDITVFGRQGDLVYVAELIDNTTAAILDWEATYDTQATAGEVVTSAVRRADGSFALGGYFTDGGASTDAMGLILDAAADAPAIPSYTAPASNGASVAKNVDPLLQWDAAAAGTRFEIFVSTTESNVTNSEATHQIDIADANGTTTLSIAELAAGITEFNGITELTEGSTYYFRIDAYDAADDLTAGAQWSFSVPMGINYIVMDATAGGFGDSGNKAGFNSAAADAYDAYDVAEPPAPGANYTRAYFYESANSPDWQDFLTENWRDMDGKDLETETHVFPVQVKTDQEAQIDFTFDITTGNANSYPTAFWDAAADEGAGAFVQVKAGALTYNGPTSDGSATYDFALLYGDQTAPVVTSVLPDPAGDHDTPGTATVIQRSLGATIDVGFDNTNPIWKMELYFSKEDDTNEPRENFFAVPGAQGGSAVVYDTPDDPSDGITNANLTFDWSPFYDNPQDGGDIILVDSIFPDAQLRIVTTDWAGNTTTTDIDVEIGPDLYEFTGDWGLGWHLIGFPIKPDEDLPADVFTTAANDGDEGVKGDFSLFKYSLAGGNQLETDVSIGKGYWLVLDEANTAANSSNDGLGTVEGTIPAADEAVVTALDKNGAWNLVGTTIRTADIGDGKTYRVQDWELSVDGGNTWLTWADAITASHVAENSVLPYDNTGGDYAAALDDATGDLTPGKGYSFQVVSNEAGAYQLRQVRDTINLTIAPSDGEGDNGNARELNDIEEGEWQIPVSVRMNGMSNNFTAFGAHPDAQDGWDTQFDLSAPPVPPTGEYIRLVLDHADWNASVGRFFVRDIRSPFTYESTEAEWDFMLIGTQTGVASVTFDVSALEQYEIPEGFHAEATVNGTVYDLLESQTIAFNYEGGQQPIHVRAYLTNADVIGDDSALPTEYKLESIYPNPFNPSTKIRVALPEAGNLTLKVFNVLGKEVASLSEGAVTAGYHNFVFDAKGMASGVYFVRVRVPGKLDSVKKITLVR